MGDELFPFPEPDFIFVHDVYLFSPSMQTRQTDERGKVSMFIPEWTGSGYVVNGANVEPTPGYLTSPDASGDTSGYIERQSISAVLLVAKTVDIDHDWIIACHDSQLPRHLAGVYTIDSVRANISHTRVLCQRHRLQWQGNVR